MRADRLRCRPWLGTYVTIRASGARTSILDVGIEQAFAAVARVHHLMSAHDETSDVRRLNRDASSQAVSVSPHTYRVLARAARLYRATGGLFDIAVAPALARWGFIPVQSDVAGVGTTADISLLDGCRVRFDRPLQIDLGGIAKGYAVDRAVMALKRAGVPAGTVNAGGDLRVFGATPQVIHIRRPDRPGESLPLLEVLNAGVATSAAYFASRRYRGGPVSPIVNPATGQPSRDAGSVTVVASSCALADALTKVVLLKGPAAASLVRRSRAAALTLAPDGRVCRYGRSCHVTASSSLSMSTSLQSIGRAARQASSSRR